VPVSNKGRSAVHPSAAAHHQQIRNPLVFIWHLDAKTLHIRHHYGHYTADEKLIMTELNVVVDS